MDQGRQRWKAQQATTPPPKDTTAKDVKDDKDTKASTGTASSSEDTKPKAPKAQSRPKKNAAEFRAMGVDSL